jgi:ABC-2 type transport system permease protein
LPSPDARRRGPYAWLLAKEWRELLASRAWWVMCVLIGPLVGVSFIGAVRTYAEASGLNGTAAGVGEAFSPLIGVWAPTFSACEIAAAFLLPFVAIRLVAGDRQSGALKIETQHSMSAFTRIGAKALVLLAGWGIVSIAPLAAVMLWRVYGGSIYTPELGAVVLGHLLNACLTIALAAAAASATEHPSTAAIVTLAVTVGTWVLNFVAAVQGGWWERAAGYTPTSMVAEFQHGLVRLDVVLIAIVLAIGGLGFAAVWTRLGLSISRRMYESSALACVVTALVLASTFVTASRDLSENRGNSFSRADEEALEQIRGPLKIEVHLAPEDPRRVDLDRRGLSRLKRVLPDTKIEYVSATSIGLFEQTAPGYGEVWYELGGRRAMSRTMTTEGVLETIYDVAGIPPPKDTDEIPFRGHPLAVPPRGAATVFYVAWPVLVAAGGFLARRSH